MMFDIYPIINRSLEILKQIKWSYIEIYRKLYREFDMGSYMQLYRELYIVMRSYIWSYRELYREFDTSNVHK